MSDDTDAESTDRWPLLGFAGALSLCCLFAAPTATGAVGATAAGGATAAAGGGIVRIAVAATTAAAVGFVLHRRVRDAGE